MNKYRKIVLNIMGYKNHDFSDLIAPGSLFYIAIVSK